jgi:hypothetical protein
MRPGKMMVVVLEIKWTPDRTTIAARPPDPIPAAELTNS